MLRDFQVKLVDGIYQAWHSGAINVMAVAPTGSGKTVCMAHIVNNHIAPGVAIAHRQELVSQISLALNREEVPHGLICPDNTLREIIGVHMATHGKSYFHSSAPFRVAGVDTLIRRDPKESKWFEAVRLVIHDEGHHVLKANKWGKAHSMFPNAKGLLFTAHALRTDNKALGRDADGIVDKLVVGPSARELIDRGMLSDYRLIAPPRVAVDVSKVDITESGEFNQAQLREAVHSSSTIVGDVVDTYCKFAGGKLGLTFAVDIESAQSIMRAYVAAGVPAAIITGETPIHVRAELMRRFRSRQLLQLVSVDVLGEGTDVPAVEVVSMARPTASFQLYAQIFGRALRIMVDDAHASVWGSYSDEERKAIIAAGPKPSAIIIDHVQNYVRHGLPDVARGYVLTRPRKKKKANPVLLRACVECSRVFDSYLLACPYCGAGLPAPAGRGTPEQVEGDLEELDPAVLRELRGEAARVDGPVIIPRGLVDSPAAVAIMRAHNARQGAQNKLRHTMRVWAGWQLAKGLTMRESHKLFFLTFGVDVMSAAITGANDADALRERIQAELDANNIVEATP